MGHVSRLVIFYMAGFSDDFDTTLRSERELADLQAQANTPVTPTEADPGTWVRKDTFTAKGDIPAATAAANIGRQPVGSNGQVLTADSSTTTGLKWATPVATGYLEYVALLTQAGGAAPVATVLANTLGGTVVWSRVGAGQYLATLAGVFTANKTMVIVSPGILGTGLGVQCFSSQASVNTVGLNTVSVIDAAQEDDLMAGTTIIIRVYS